MKFADMSALASNGHVPTDAYVYTDLAGTPIAATARFAVGTLEKDKKSFRAFRREGDAWISGLDGMALPLYRSAELLNQIGAGGQAFIAEGEKCVDALWDAGLAATTNAFGAGKWEASYAETLRGLNVVVLPDNDAVGLKHAETVANSLVGIAASVRIVVTPGVEGRMAGDGWDVADWLAAGGTAEVLSQIAASAPPYSGPATANDWPEPTPLGDSDEPEPFPIEQALTPRLAEFAVAVSEAVKIDVTAPAVIIPAILSIAGGNAFDVQVSGSYREPNLSRYVLYSKPSGERGSELFRQLARPLDNWMNKNQAEFEKKRDALLADMSFYTKRAEGIERRAGNEKDATKVEMLRQQAAEARAKIPKVPRRPLLYMGDTTSEAHARGMAEQGGAMGMLSADARHAVDAILGRYRGDGKTDDSVYLRAHGGDTIDRGRVGNSVAGEYMRIPRPQIGMALAVQPDKLGELGRRPELLASGFLPRCNTFAAPSRVGNRIETGYELPVSEELRDGWDWCIRGLIELRQQLMAASGENDWKPVTVALDPEAMELRRVFANEIELRQAPDGDLHGAAAFASKCAGEAARLAALLHLAELSFTQRLSEAAYIPIPATTWRIAEAHQRWQLAETLRVLSLAQEEQTRRLARRVLKWAARRPDLRREVSPRALIAGRIPKDSAEAVEVMTLLCDLGWARPTKASKPGHERWDLNPVIFGGAA